MTWKSQGWGELYAMDTTSYSDGLALTQSSSLCINLSGRFPSWLYLAEEALWLSPLWKVVLVHGNAGFLPSFLLWPCGQEASKTWRNLNPKITGLGACIWDAYHDFGSICSPGLKSLGGQMLVHGNTTRTWTIELCSVDGIWNQYD